MHHINKQSFYVICNILSAKYLKDANYKQTKQQDITALLWCSTLLANSVYTDG